MLREEALLALRSSIQQEVQQQRQQLRDEALLAMQNEVADSVQVRRPVCCMQKAAEHCICPGQPAVMLLYCKCLGCLHRFPAFARDRIQPTNKKRDSIAQKTPYPRSLSAIRCLSLISLC